MFFLVVNCFLWLLNTMLNCWDSRCRST